MIPGLALAFAQPWLLAALALLPAIWLLLRFTPPRPVRIAFPPTRILMEIDPQQQTPARTPWWLVLLRMVIAALVIFALAQPVLNPPAVVTGGSGPLMVVVDNGWGAEPRWDRISASADQILAQAESDGRPTLFVATAGERNVGTPGSAGEARERLAGLSPAPHAPDRAGRADALADAIASHGIDEVVWFSDGLEHGDGEAFAARLAESGADLRLIRPEDSELPVALSPPAHESGALTVEAVRAGAGGAGAGTILARDLRGRVVGQMPYSFAPGEATASVAFDLPVEIRNDVSRLEIAEARTSGAVQLLDDRWRRRVVGLVSGETREAAQPLLSPLYYITRALGPFADLREGNGSSVAASIDRLLEDGVSALVLADIGTLIGESRAQVEDWVADGGVLIRFAGPRLAGAEEEDELLPATLRRGERALGGTLSWSEPQELARFPSDGPFAGVEVPADVRVERQVLAEPSGDLAEKSWANLADGTPLVTGERHGQGWVVLFHVTADANWSNLPLSGAFVEMLRRVVDLSGAAGDGAPARGGDGGVLRPLQMLDAQGALTSPPPSARPIEAQALADTRPRIEHPPGLYGEPDAYRSLNVIAAAEDHQPLNAPGIAVAGYPADDPRAIGPWLLAAALLLLIADGIAVLLLGGRQLRSAGFARAGARAGAALVAVALVAGAPGAQAEDAAADEFALRATLETRLAYVITGNERIDETSRRGLEGLTRALTNRTALEPAEPIGVDIARDELAFFPFIYWPIDHDAERPPDEVLTRIDAYMMGGGTILFDTRDEIEARPDGTGSSVGPGMQRLRVMMRGLDLPALEPVPSDHVLTKTFYLLQDFPGRWEGGTLWVEATQRDEDAPPRPAHNADGVSAVVITSNDFAGAWAVDESGRPTHPVSPGGDWQRELAVRSGINIIMYAMTGNYKADQVHVPALLERLGQ